MIENFAFETIYILYVMSITACNKLNYLNKFENSIKPPNVLGVNAFFHRA